MTKEFLDPSRFPNFARTVLRFVRWGTMQSPPLEEEDLCGILSTGLGQRMTGVALMEMRRQAEGKSESEGKSAQAPVS